MSGLTRLAVAAALAAAVAAQLPAVPAMAAAPAAPADSPAGAGLTVTTIRPGQPPEAKYLVEDHSALREIGYDPLTPFTRIADGASMYFTYRFAPGRGQMAWLLIGVGTQYLISASADGGKTWTWMSDVDRHELVGTRTFVDLTPLLRRSGEVLLRFEDKYKQDGWGALLSEIDYVRAGTGERTRQVLDAGWQVAGGRAGGKPYQPGAALKTAAPVTFACSFFAPAAWRGHDLAVYLPGVLGSIAALRLNRTNLPLKRTWDWGYWADVSRALRAGGTNRLDVEVRPAGGEAGLWAPVRVGLLAPACAVPAEKVLGDRKWRPDRAFAPYTREKMNFLAGNFMQCLYDNRYDLLAFQPGERMPIHFVHDTLRSLMALADEERYTPVVRLALIRRLYRGCRRAILPGGQYLLAGKQDSRPLDIRPLAGTPLLTTVYKWDVTSQVAGVGPELPDTGGGKASDAKGGAASASGAGKWATPATFHDAPIERRDGGWTFTRTWTRGDRKLSVRAFYPPGDADRPPYFDFALDGKGPVRLDVSRLAEKGYFLMSGSWGPEAAVLGDGRTLWAGQDDLRLSAPPFRYLFLRGGNTGSYTFCKAVLILWDGHPRLVVGTKVPGGRKGSLWSDVALEYANSRPSHVRLIVLPFDGFPADLVTPRAIVKNVLRTGKYGVGAMDPLSTSSSSGLGPGGMAAAAYEMRKYHCPEAAQAEDLALKCMKAFTALDRAGTTTNQLYYLINGCQYFHLLGHTEYDRWARTWADRIVKMQGADGSWPWLDFQLRNMIALERAYDLLGDPKYRAALDRALATLSYRDGQLYWKGKVAASGDFDGALPFAIYGHLGRYGVAQEALAARANYINDTGFFGCSDLNPYMLGFSRGPKPWSGARKILGLTDFAEYDGGQVKILSRPTAYVVNPHCPLAREVSFPLVAAE